MEKMYDLQKMASSCLALPPGGMMRYKYIEQRIDLNDPETGFSFSFDDDQINLRFVDWKNTKVTIRFYMTYSFTFRIASGWKSLPNAQFIEILNSDLINALRNELSASAEEEIHHYIISTNEDEWCEIVAGRFELEKQDFNLSP